MKSVDIKLFRSANPVARISQLAVHLDREVNERGLTLDKHLHLSPAWSSDQKAPSFLNWVAQQTKCTVRDIVSIDAQLFDMHKAAVVGADSSFIASGRLDLSLIPLVPCRPIIRFKFTWFAYTIKKTQ